MAPLDPPEPEQPPLLGLEVAPHGTASFIELDKAVVSVIRLASFL